MDEKKSCENCKHFSRHYSTHGTHFLPVCCGHCNHGNKNRFKKTDPRKVCECWEDAAIMKKERRQSIKENLKHMAKRLKEMADILKDDTE